MGSYQAVWSLQRQTGVNNIEKVRQIFNKDPNVVRRILTIELETFKDFFNEIIRIYNRRLYSVARAFDSRAVRSQLKSI